MDCQVCGGKREVIRDAGHSAITEECQSCQSVVSICQTNHQSIVFCGSVCPLCLALNLTSEVVNKKSTEKEKGTT